MPPGNKKARKNLPKHNVKKKGVSGETLKRYKLFAAEWIIDFNGTRAAKAAGYSERTAYSIGHELLKKPEVRELIREAIAERNERLQVDADWLLKRLIDETTADLGDILNPDGTVKPVAEWPMIWRQGLVTGLEVDEITTGRGKKRKRVGQTIKIKLADRTRNKEMIGKHINVQAFNDRSTVDIGGPALEIILGALPPEYAEAVRQKIREAVKQ
jgi:phage terminase small subunit